MLRRLRTGAGLTQEELAYAAALSPRSVSDIERGINQTTRKNTARLLADALGLTGPEREEFAVAARGLEPARRPAAAGGGSLTDIAASAGGAAAAARTLPRDVHSFIGRQDELLQLADIAVATSGVVGIYAIGGMAGVGKTAFAVHAAHELAPRFPDGQIFLPLHGHTPGQLPVDPADALASLLQTAGVTAERIPPGMEARMALWRDHLADKQLLLLLDDAADSAQVGPLLPGAGECLVLVTSRRRLTALDDAHAISLDTLPPDEAAGLLVRLAVRPGLSPADPAVAEITGLCGYLPLAVGMLARQLHHHPAWSLADLADDLTAARNRLEFMTAEDLSVAAAFDLSYTDLNPAHQRLFRRLGLHPGADVDAYAAAALDDTNLATARRGLEALYDQYLLTEPARGRYRMHDLIREHARALALGDPDSDRELATGRLLDYYQRAAALADTFIARQVRSIPSPADCVIPAEVPALADREQALAWGRAERAKLLACLDYATGTGQRARVIALTAHLAGLLRHDGPWAEALARHEAALQAARHLGDRTGEANALTDLGEARQVTGNYLVAVRDLEEALGIFRDLGDRVGQAKALLYLGEARGAAGDYPSAARDLEEVLGIFSDLGDRPGQANALINLGKVRRLAGNYRGATRDLEEALGIFRDLGDRLGQASTINDLGWVWRLTGVYPGAVRDLEEALGIFRHVADRRGQANALVNLGDARRLTRDYPGAVRDLEEALGIFRDLGLLRGQANAFLYLGDAWRETGDYREAAKHLEEALRIYRDIGDLGGRVEALNEAGTLHRMCGDLGQARSCHQQALALARQIGSSWDEAHALAGLGRYALAFGHAAEAERRLRQALEIFQRIGAAAITDVSAELDALTNALPTAQGP
jgi:tetratricopeptide (TPR) repeat protein/transcriptional regulator with XRE-family HTH domain